MVQNKLSKDKILVIVDNKITGHEVKLINFDKTLYKQLATFFIKSIARTYGTQGAILR